MASGDETIRLGFAVDTADLPRATRATADLKKATDTYAVAATQAVSAAKMYNQAVNGYAVAAAPAITAAQLHARAMNAATVAALEQEKANVRNAVSVAMTGRAATAAGAGMGGAANGGRDFGRSLLEVSRLAEDAQYGIAGVLNNIPTLVMAMGGGGGVAGAISLVAVGANLVYKNWDSIAGLWREGHTETEAERMERLGKATHRTAEEQKELNKHKALQSSIEKVAGTQSRDQQNSAAGINSAIGIVGGATATADLTRVLLRLSGLAEDFGGTLRLQAETLLGQAAGGNIQAADNIRSAFATTQVGRDSVTGRVLETGDAEARRRALEAMDAEAKAKAEGERQSKVEEAAARLGRIQGGTFGLRGTGNLFDDLAKVKQELIDSGETKDVAERIAQDVWAKVRESMEDKVRDYAANNNLSVEAARGELLGLADIAANPAPRKKPAMGPGRDVFAAAQLDVGVAAAQARQRREDSIEGIISNRTNSEGVVGDFIARARQNRFADRRYARKFGRMGLEDRIEETGRANAQDDAAARKLEQQRLIRLGISPARATRIAEENVANARKALNGETGDVESQDRKELTMSNKELVDQLRELNRRGLIARFG